MFLQAAVSVIDEHMKQERKWCSQEIWWTIQLLHACRKRKSMKFLFYCMCIYWQQIQWLYFIFFFFSFWTWEYLKLGMWLRDNTAQNTEACKTSCIWSSTKKIVRGLSLGKKQKRTYPLKVKLVTDWQIFKGCWYISPLQGMCETDSWDGVAEVFLKAWPASLNRAAQHCCMCIFILWSKTTQAWHSSGDCHPPWPLRFSVGNSCIGTIV